MTPRTTVVADPSRGRLLAAGIVLLAVALALFAIWFQWRQTRRCLAFYGSAAARRIQNAARVELWDLPSVSALDGPQPSSRYDVTRAGGLVHLRRGLVEDANFDWGTGEGGPKGGAGAGLTRSWDAALAFYDEKNATEPGTVLGIDFDRSGGVLGIAGQPGAIGLGRMEAGLRTWIDATRAVAPRR